jgi:SAM-dependent methyltransferase
MSADDATLKDIGTAAVKRYSARFATYGYDARSLGWGSAEHQRYRFSQTLDGPVDFRSRKLLDIGCGFGDYRSFLRDAGVELSGYEGWDLNTELVAEAKQRHASDPGSRFVCRDFMLYGNGPTPGADIAVMLGLLNFNLGDKMDNYAYAELAMRRAWALAREALIVDFLSARRMDDYAPEPWVFYYEPQRMLDVALGLSPRVVLKHDYRPIPQREFMLFVMKG